MSNGKGGDATALSLRIVPVDWWEMGFTLARVWNDAAGAASGLTEGAAHAPQPRLFRAVLNRLQQRTLIRRILEERKSLVAAGYGAALLPHEASRLASDARIVTRALRPAL
jgi:hypothetical protein